MEEEHILKLMGAAGYEPLTLTGLLQVLKVQGRAREATKKRIMDLVDTGKLAWVRKNRLCLAGDAGVFTGTLIVRKSGWGLLKVDPQLHCFCPESLTIEPKNLGCALHGDRIRVQLYTASHRSARQDEHYAKPTKLLECKHQELIGTLAQGQYFVSDDPRIPVRAKIKCPKGVSIGDTILVSVAYSLHKRTMTFKQKLGSSGEPETDMQALLKRYGLDPEFPEAVQTQVKRFPKRVSAQSCEGRTDLRDVLTVTIDPEDAKDFDDALSLEPLMLGRVRIGIHIADVATYVKPGTPLDEEARKRGNSTYLGPTVIPMLPFALSNELCSLKPRVDRLAKSVLLTFSKSGRLLKTEFANSVIRSNRRLTYAQAYDLLQTKPKKTDKPEAQLVRTLWTYANRLRDKRMKAGSLDLDMPEVRIQFNAQGRPEALIPVEHDESHQLVEEFMLAANESAAKALREKGLPALYRVHDAPDPAKLEELAVSLKEHGLRVPDLHKPNAVAQVLQRLKKHPQAYVLKLQVLRSLKQACYDIQPLGHYGLGKRDYLHFTSPIRRYADLIVHRSLERLMGISKGASGLSQLGAVANHISKTEQNSTEAERDFKKRKRLLYYADALKNRPQARYTALIVDVKTQGLFVELPDTLTFGFLPAQTLGPDTYQLSKDKKALIGRTHGRSFALGQAVTVQLLSVDPRKQEIDFRLARS